MSRHIILVDAHVHVYPGADVPGLLEAAARNFLAAATALGASSWQGVMMLTEVVSADWFDSVAEPQGGRRIGEWEVAAASGELISLQARAGDTELTIVAGRQIVTAERIEVHALGTRAKFADDMDAEATLEAVRAAGALAILPWGVGKWLGRRGRLVDRLLATAKPRVLAADIGGRPGFWREQRFAKFGDRPLLKGTDPLPLVGEEYRVGECGTWLEGSLPANAVAKALIERLTTLPPAEIHRYGSTESVSRFLRNQLLLRSSRHRLGHDSHRVN